MNFDKYITKLPYPKKISKPVLKNNATSTEIREYANLVEQYEKDCVIYKELFEKYHKNERELYDMFIYDLIVDLGLKHHPFQIAIINLAWERGHSEGYSQVYDIASDLTDRFEITEEIRKKMKQYLDMMKFFS